MLCIILTIVVQCTKQNQRIVQVSVSISGVFTNGEDHECCVYGNCTCNSLDHALAKLTSNVLINITTNVMLSSFIKVSDLQNISVIGHNNPTVNCKTGGIHFTFCHNCIIQGVTWDGCGMGNTNNNIEPNNNNEPGLKLSDSSNVILQNCSFQHSIGQAIMLSEMSGDITISHCSFVNNSHYRDHGAAIHYSTHHGQRSYFLITISNCNFENNKLTKSLVYFQNTLFVSHRVILSNSIFSHNQGISIYASNHKINLNGRILFRNNVAENGTGIYMCDHSTVVFDENSSVVFDQNSANDSGGAIFITNHSVCLLDHNCVVKFNYNKGAKGGAIYSEANSSLTFKGTCEVTFSSNSAVQYGAAIISLNTCHIIFAGSSRVTFNSNIMPHSRNRHSSGIIYTENSCYISFEGNSTTVFSNNSADDGGAIFSHKNSCISFRGNSVTVFSSNTAHYSGGSIFSFDNSCIYSKGNSSVVFSNNTAEFGGAIYSDNVAHISFEENSNTEFSNNTADDGGTIYAENNCLISFKGNSATVLSGNTADDGGAMFTKNNCHISFEENSTTVISNNTADDAGALYSEDNSGVSFKGNSKTMFINNNAKFGGGAISCNFLSYVSFQGDSFTVFSNNTADNGGAMFSENYCHLYFEGNSMIKFSNNAANRHGGAIESTGDSKMSFKGNSSARFSDNTAHDGGGICLESNCHINFEETSIIVFNNNTASNSGGAILADNQCEMTFNNNSALFFTNNTAALGATIFSKRDSKTVVRDHSSVVFNNLSAKWCADICLPYPEESDAIAIDTDGAVWCNKQKAFTCVSDKCHCTSLEEILHNVSVKYNQVINIINKVVSLSSIINLDFSISIIGHNNPVVVCAGNSGLKISHRNLKIEGITWIGCGAPNIMNVNGAVLDKSIAVLALTGLNNVTIQNCSFQYSSAPVISLSQVTGTVNINNCKFVNNTYKGDGAAINYLSYSGTLNVVTISNCQFSSNKGVKSVIYFKQYNYGLHGYNNTYLINSSFHNNEGTSIYLSRYYNLHLIGEVLFKSNVAEDGAGIYINDHSSVVFRENSNIKFIDNSVNHNGSAIFLTNNSSAIFNSNSKVVFDNNKASSGTIYSKHNSNVIFKETSAVTFRSNLAAQYGSAIYSCDNSQVTFKGNSTVIFNSNSISSNDAHLQHGGTILSEDNSNVAIEENSVTVFSGNSADFGSAIFSIRNSNVIFKDNSKVMFSNNIAHYCGVLTSALFSNITFTDNTEVTYDSNTVSYILSSNHGSSAGTICTFQRSEIIFTEHSLVTFINNKADRGGAVIIYESNVIMEEYSKVIFSNNNALYSSGGALVCSNNSNVTIKGNSNVTFNNNKASQSGGAIFSYNMCRITFKDNSTTIFADNIARNNGGAVVSNQLSKITLEGNSMVTFDGNTADNGGVFYFSKSTIVFKKSSIVSFYNNKATQSGGVGYFNFKSLVIFEGLIVVRFVNNIAEQNAGVIYTARSNVLFKGNSTITITHSKATLSAGALYFDKSSDASFAEFTKIAFQYNKAFYGGAITANNHSNIVFGGNSALSFDSNEATQNGGSAYFNYSSNFIIKENANIRFDHNKAFQGGAVCISEKTKFTTKGNSTILFYNNSATVSGGAVNSLKDSKVTLKDHINVKFTGNNAEFGGAVFLDTTAVMVNSSYKKCINFINNIAKISGNSVYQDAAQFYNRSYLVDRMVGISSEFLATPPNELKFYGPAICIDNDNATKCNIYYVQDIMLGSKIVVPACVLDHYNQSVKSTQFFIYNEIHPNCFISGPKQTLISCDVFEGISIMGNHSLSERTNFSINITLNVALNSNWKQISVNLIIGLSPCHPGFWQYPKLKKCECYNASDIVFCSGSSSTIRRGYWFGNVTGKPTVTYCPISYCNFNCCETSNGYYHLSPVRDNQCRLHRSGAACGSCEEGYTLSFDSVECVHMNECSIGWTILVLVLVVLYWIFIIVAVFSFMHFKVGIGYLYAITYYYSVVDLFLSQNWYHSNALYVIINILSSISKIIPQFLGQFCLIENMSGIDQQFIHYIHPVAISLFLVMITVLARRSHRLSSFISKRIIHVICCLLLLSYTSLATTSLLLMRPLMFYDVDVVYTYVSPDVEYFHGRHLVYAIVAVLFTIVIVIGLPLLLALEPFLNSKINFVKIKPLLDQFQSCYKDNFRCFAAYYMICRLIIITIIIANSSNDFIFQYALVCACVLMDLIHQIVKPYSKSLLNVIDGVILHVLVLVSILPLIESFNNFNTNLAVGITFALVISPLLIFIAISLILNKEKIKKLPGYCYSKYLQLRLRNYREVSVNETEVSSNENEFVNIIDDSRRVNATICDV